MTWRDRLRRASYKGVGFYFDEARSSFGRRTIVKEMPGSDVPHTEDLGRRARVYSFAAFLVGPDYDIARDAMRLALEDEEPGILVHPYLGPRLVRLTGETEMVETTDEGGMVRFGLTFVDASREPLLSAQRDPLGELDDAVAKAKTAVEQAMAGAFAVTNAVAEVREAAVSLVESATDTLREVKAGIDQGVGIVDDVVQTIDDLAAVAEAIVSIPGDLAAALTGAIAEVVSSVLGVGAAVERITEIGDTLEAPFRSGSVSENHRGNVLMVAWRRLDAFGDDETIVLLEGESGTAAVGQANHEALVLAFRAAAATSAAAAAGVIEFESYDQAVAVRDELADALDGLAADVDDVTYIRMLDARAALTRRLTSVAELLPRVVDFELRDELPALVVAQQLYGDATREPEIVDRNGIRNPLLVPAGSTLRVLAS